MQRRLEHADCQSESAEFTRLRVVQITPDIGAAPWLRNANYVITSAHIEHQPFLLSVRTRWFALHSEAMVHSWCRMAWWLGAFYDFKFGTSPPTVKYRGFKSSISRRHIRRLITRKADTRCFDELLRGGEVEGHNWSIYIVKSKMCCSTSQSEIAWWARNSGSQNVWAGNFCESLDPGRNGL